MSPTSPPSGQAWLQEFSWTQADVRRDLQHRNAHVPEAPPQLPKAQGAWAWGAAGLGGLERLTGYALQAFAETQPCLMHVARDFTALAHLRPRPTPINPALLAALPPLQWPAHVLPGASNPLLLLGAAGV